MKLPLLVHPSLKSTLDIAFPLDILESNNLIDDETLYYCWQLYLSGDETMVAFLDNHLMNNELFFEKKTMDISKENLVENIIKAVEGGGYVVTFLDEFYIPERYTYHRNHFMHGNMIFGYEREHQIFYATAFTNRGKYEETRFSFEEFLSAVNTSGKDVQPLSFIYVLHPKKRAVIPQDERIFLYYLQGYYHSFDVVHQRTNAVFGMEAIKRMAKNFSLKTCRIAPLYAIREHKHLTQKRFHKLYQRGLIAEDFSHAYQAVVDDADMIIMLWLRYRVTHQESLEESIRNKLFELIKKEEDIFAECFQLLK